MMGMTVDRIGSQTTIPTDFRSQQTTATENSTFTLKTAERHQQMVEHGQLNKEELLEAVDELNTFLEPVRRNLKFELHEKLERYYVMVIDSNTSEVIKEIPPKKILDMHAAMMEFMGLLVDRKI